MKKRKLPIYILVSFFALLCLTLDIFILKDYDLDLSNIIQIMLTAISVLFTLMFSYLIFLKQRFSYNKKVFENQFLKIIDFLLIFFGGLISLIFKELFYSFEILYILISSFYIVYYTFILYGYMENNELKKILNIQSNKKLIKEEITIEVIKTKMHQYTRVYSNEYFKENFEICLQIINASYIFLEKAIESRNNDIIKGNSFSKEAEKLLLSFFISFFKKDISDFTLKLNDMALLKLKEYIILLIKCNIDNSIENVMNLYFEICHNYSNYITKDSAIKNLYLLSKEAHKNNNFNLFKKIDKLNQKFLFTLNIEDNQSQNSFYIIKYYNTIFKNVLTENDEYFKFVFKQFSDFIFSFSISISLRQITYVFRTIMEKNYYSANKEIMSEIHQIILLLLHTKKYEIDDFFIAFLCYYCGDRYLEMEDIVNEFKYICLDRLLNTKMDIPRYLFPEYGEYNKNETLNIDFCTKEATKIYDLIEKSLINNKVETTRDLFDILENIIKSYNVDNNEHISIWMGVYDKLLYGKYPSKENHITSLIIYYFRKCIFSLSDAKKVSHDISMIILEMCCDISSIKLDNDVELVSKVLELLFDFLDEKNNLSFVYGAKGVEDEIYKYIYYICIEAIEYRQEKIIRKISNFLGWKLKYKIDNNKLLANKIIDYVCEIYMLCLSNDMSDDVKIFVGTLFIFIGAYCETDSRYSSFKIRIKNKLSKLNCRKYLEKSKIIRESRKDVWSKYLKGDTKKYFDQFFEFLFKK